MWVFCPNIRADSLVSKSSFWPSVVKDNTGFLCKAESKRFRITISARVWSLFPLDKIPTMTRADRFDYCHPPVPPASFFWQTLVATIQQRRGWYKQKSLVTSPDFDCETVFEISAPAFCKRSFAVEWREKTKKENKASGYIGGGVGFGPGPTLLNRDVWIDDRHWPFFPPAGPWRPGLPVQPRLCSA